MIDGLRQARSRRHRRRPRRGHVGGFDGRRPDRHRPAQPGGGVPHDDQTREIQVDIDLDQLHARLAELTMAATSVADALSRIGRMALDTETVPEPVRRAIVEGATARARMAGAPARGGRRRRPRRHDGAVRPPVGRPARRRRGGELRRARCLAPTTIEGRRYIDGGVRSFTNTDLAAGCARILVLIPVELLGPAQEQFDRELEGLGSTPTLVVRADRASLDTIGANPLDPKRRRPALEAAIAQSAAEADAVKEFCDPLAAGTRLITSWPAAFNKVAVPGVSRTSPPTRALSGCPPPARPVRAGTPSAWRASGR